MDTVLQPHDRINFNLRPNKRIERKLIAEALMCLYRFDSPRRYGYVGMGSYYFSDFTLFHRVFGITNMISIERDEDNEERFIFNKPFDCIAMQFGSTHDILPTLAIFRERPVICWLDYYDRLTDAILGDIQCFVRRAELGSVLIVTLKGSAFNKPADIEEFFRNLPSEAKTPANKALLSSPKGIRDFMLSIIEMRMESVLSDLNQANQAPIVIKRLFNLVYKDGVAMVTFGWLKLDKERMGKLEDVPTALDAPLLNLNEQAHLEINTPPLTFREIAHLKALLPNGLDDSNIQEKAKPLRAEDARQFAKFYRYYPNFADIEE